MPLRRSNESLIFGAKVSADDMLRSGFANRVFPDSSFRSEVSNYLQEMMETNEPGSMLEAKRLVLDPLRENRHLANFRAHDVGAALFASGLPNKRFKERAEMLARKGKARM